MNNIILPLLVFFVLIVSFPPLIGADDKIDSVQIQKEKALQPDSAEQGSASVIQSFATDNSAKSEIVQIEDQTKRLVMFVMGVPLLILLFATAALGVAMGVYGKQVFVPHMVCAGLSLTLALGHAVVGIVWFYPF